MILFNTYNILTSYRHFNNYMCSISFDKPIIHQIVLNC